MNVESTPQQADSNRSITQLIYAMYALSLVVGITWLVGIVLNYVKRDDVVGTIYESHFRWQIRTFWFSLLWCVIGVITMFVIVGFFVLGFAAVWYVYRIVKGWLRLSEGKAMYVVP